MGVLPVIEERVIWDAYMGEAYTWCIVGKGNIPDAYRGGGYTNDA